MLFTNKLFNGGLAMVKNTERKIKNKKIGIALMEYVITLGCLLVAFVMMTGKERVKQTNSYAKPEEEIEYRIEDWIGYNNLDKKDKDML